MVKRTTGGRPTRKPRDEPADSTEGRTVCSKKEFALARGRTPKQVTIWLKRGIITPAAVIGEGHRAKIWVEQADRDIATNMHPGHASKLDTTAPEPVSRSTDSENLSRRRAAEADQAEMRAEQTRRQMAIDAGDYIEREAAERAWGRELQELMQNIEIWAATSMPQEIAAEMGVDWKKLSAAVRKSWRDFRQEIVDRKRQALNGHGKDEDRGGDRGENRVSG